MNETEYFSESLERLEEVSFGMVVGKLKAFEWNLRLKKDTLKGARNSAPKGTKDQSATTKVD